MNDLFLQGLPPLDLGDLVLDAGSKQTIVQLIREHRFSSELRQYGLPCTNKVLLHGQSGCGKSSTARAISTALNKGLLVLNLSQIVCARIGETARNLKLVFDRAAKENAVLFLDELDQIAAHRTDEQRDVGEMRRLVNSLIQLIDFMPEKILLLSATNHVSLIDAAVLRRFQVKIRYTSPAADVLDAYYDRLLSQFPPELRHAERCYGISFAEARDHLHNSVKANLLNKLENTTDSSVVTAAGRSMQPGRESAVLTK